MSHSESKPLPHQLVDKEGQITRDPPWIFRTYAGHSSAKTSNELYRANLAKGQTGLSIAFDLATQCGYDSDDRTARGRQGGRAHQLARRLPRPLRRDPDREDEHVDDHQRHGHVAAVALRR